MVPCLEKRIVAQQHKKIRRGGQTDQLGAVGGGWCVANGPSRMKKLAQELQLAQSVGEINRTQAEDKRKKAVILARMSIESSPQGKVARPDGVR